MMIVLDVKNISKLKEFNIRGVKNEIYYRKITEICMKTKLRKTSKRREVDRIYQLPIIKHGGESVMVWDASVHTEALFVKFICLLIFIIITILLFIIFIYLVS